jgi:hypothetical protein
VSVDGEADDAHEVGLGDQAVGVRVQRAENRLEGRPVPEQRRQQRRVQARRGEGQEHGRRDRARLGVGGGLVVKG